MSAARYIAVVLSLVYMIAVNFINTTLDTLAHIISYHYRIINSYNLSPLQLEPVLSTSDVQGTVAFTSLVAACGKAQWPLALQLLQLAQPRGTGGLGDRFLRSDGG